MIFHRRAVIWGVIVTGALFLVVVGVLAYAAFPPSKKTTPSTPLVTEVKLRQVAEGFEQPLGIVPTQRSGDTDLYIVEQSGTIRRLSASGNIAQEPLLDISSKVEVSGEMGLLGLVFDPNFAKNGHFYVNYVDTQRQTHIARFTRKPGAEQAVTSSEKTLLKVAQPYGNHKGGDLQFGSDGYLYIALGDGGAAGDPQNRAQNTNSLLGKILRIKPTDEGGYTIPQDNPLRATAGARPEIWAYGLRNPWRLSFDANTQDLWIADVGQGAVEEVNRQPAASKGGENYGWRCFEGNKPYGQADACDEDYTPPLFTYDRTSPRCSVTGGFVYRGKTLTGLTGRYFFADYCSGELLQYDTQSKQTGIVLTTPYAISTLGQDVNRELYLADIKGGAIYKIDAR